MKTSLRTSSAEAKPDSDGKSIGGSHSQVPSRPTAADIEQEQRMEEQIPVWKCPRCSYVMSAEEEIGDDDELLAEFERVGQTMIEGERDPEPGEIAQCFRCGKFAVIGEDLQLRMPTTDEQLAINTNAHLTESQIVWASFTGERRK